MLTYKTSGRDILEKLKEKGFTTTRIRKEKIIPEGMLTKLRKNEIIGPVTLATLCELLEVQPGEIVVSVDPETGRLHGKKEKFKKAQ